MEGEKMSETAYPQARLVRKAMRLQRLTDGYYSGKVQHGEERFLETETGRVRVLCYGLEDTRVLPLFVNIHGGGFVIGHPEMDDPYMPRIVAEADVKIISVDYSLAPQYSFPTPLEQCYATIKYAQDNADEFGIDPERVAVGGHSAGGNFTAAVCLLDAERRELNLKAAILDYPVLDIYTPPTAKQRGRGLVAMTFLNAKNAEFFNRCYCFDKKERRNSLVSPVYADSEQLRSFPPTFILTAGLDSLCAEAENFRDMLSAAGVNVTHKRFEKSTHGFTLSNKSDAREGWRLMIEHLQNYL
jgi:acetyl esterase